MTDFITTLFLFILSHNANNIYGIKSLILQSTKLTSQHAELSIQTSAAFCTLPGHPCQLPPTSPFDFIKPWTDTRHVKPRLFLSNKGTAKTRQPRLPFCGRVPSIPCPHRVPWPLYVALPPAAQRPSHGATGHMGSAPRHTFN